MTDFLAVFRKEFGAGTVEIQPFSPQFLSFERFPRPHPREIFHPLLVILWAKTRQKTGNKNAFP
ncbi:hypothetical protein [Bifidobacterium choloepi]|uniref:Uncharacterized protein n=1 Tax=Bifidobacterium choloepi TaxID=2614131 RepID=A0A6I5NP81_9BIFI|nr:hypothetical protein [Bifidobacterium choloepi]NEG70512.1 hypothetical protein [Bifidobacterium choloepi]